MTRRFTELSLNEIALNEDYLPFLVDTVGLTMQCDLKEIEKLLSEYKPVEVEEEKKTSHNDDPIPKSEFASAKTLYSTSSMMKNNNIYRDNTTTTDIRNHSDIRNTSTTKNTTGVDDYIIERIKNEIVESNLNLKWEDIVGLELVKKTINEIVLWPIMRPDIFTGLRGPPRDSCYLVPRELVKL